MEELKHFVQDLWRQEKTLKTIQMGQVTPTCDTFDVPWTTFITNDLWLTLAILHNKIIIDVFVTFQAFKLYKREALRRSQLNMILYLPGLVIIREVKVQNTNRAWILIWDLD